MHEAEHTAREAAQAGDIEAMFKPGVILQKRGTTSEAEEWFRTGASLDGSGPVNDWSRLQPSCNRKQGDWMTLNGAGRQSRRFLHA